jgi:AsmA protein
MRSIFKWGLIFLGGIAVLFVLILLLVPLFVDINDYKPQIEKAANQATGRELVLGGDLALSLFPWAGVTVNDVLLGSPEGFTEKEFVRVSKFEARMKLIPLLFKDIQVKHVILKGFRLTLVQQKDGHTNWDFSSSDKKSMPEEKKTPTTSSDEAAQGGGFSLKALSVGQIAVTSGVIEYIDHAKGTKNEVSDVTLKLEEISLDKPIQLSFSAKIDGKPVSLKGNVGPIGEEPGKGTISIDLLVNAFEAIELNVVGKVTDPMSSPTYQFELNIPAFSPRQLLATIDETAVPETSDSEVLKKASMSAGVLGDAQQVSLTEGQLVLDDSTLSFQVHAKEFPKPNIRWSIQLDKIDLDRYLPKTEDKKADKTSASPKATTESGKAKPPKTDYTPLRKLEMDGNLSVDELKAGGATIQQLLMKLSAKEGKIALKPLTLNLYKGKMAANGLFDVRKDTPQSTISLSAQNIQAGAMVVDMFQKDIVEGTAGAEVSLSMVGDAPAQIKKTLNGTGDLMLKDGAIKGVDLGAMLQNVQAAFGMAEKTDATTQTEFAEFHSLFKIKNGVAKTDHTILKSPVMTAKVTGNADLNKETIKFRVEPTYVDVTRKDAEGKNKTSSLVPVLVSGTFSSPKFQPDLEGVVKQALEEKLTDIFNKGKKEKKEGDTEEEADPIEDTMKGLIKQFPLGR